MVKLPEYDVLHFCFDNDNGCSLTVLANNARFHITVNPKQFQDRSKKGKEIQREYRRLLEKAKKAEQEDGEDGGATASSEEDTEDDAESLEEEERERDSAVDLSSPEIEDKQDDEPTDSEPMTELHDWILTPLSQHLPSNNASKRKISVQDWYHTPIDFYKLSTTSGKLQAKKDASPPWSLRNRLNEILHPTVCIPKKTLKLSVPQFSASDLTVLHCAADPAPFHPVLVSHKNVEYFLKPVDSTQPGPTIREIHLLHSIAEKGLHAREDFRCPELRGLVYFSSEEKSSAGEEKHIAALLLTPIPDPTPLTRLLDSAVPEHKRTQWATDAARMVEVLHENDIVWGDAKGDNFLIDGKEEKVWIIDFGGSYTEGWVDEKLKETEEGDWMGTEKVVNALEDPVNGVEDGEEDGQEMEEEGEGKEDREEGKEDKEEEEELKKGEEIDEHGPDPAENEPTSDETLSTNPSDTKTNSDPNAASHQTPPSNPSPRKRRLSTTTTRDDSTPAPPTKQQKRNSTTTTTSRDETPASAKYCICNNVSSGRMLACDGKDCRREWFHFECLGIEEAPEGEEWFCEECSSN